MTLVLDSVQGVLTILLMILVGYWLTKKGWFDEKASALLSRIVIGISLPALMVSNISSSFDKEAILRLGPGVIVPLVTILSSYGLAYLLGMILRLPPKRRGLFRALFAFSNTIFVGLPVNIALFGDASVPFVTLYYLVNTTLFWTIGVYYIRRDGEDKDVKLLSLETLRRIVTPVLISFIIAIGLVFLDIKLPRFLQSSLKYAANLTTPLSMLIIGITIESIGIRGIRVTREMIAVLAGRFIVAPATAWFVLSRIEAPDLMRKVFFVVAAMPVMTQIAIVSKAYDADHRSASIMVTVTTVASLFIIPFYMFFFGG